MKSTKEPYVKNVNSQNVRRIIKNAMKKFGYPDTEEKINNWAKFLRKELKE